MVVGKAIPVPCTALYRMCGFKNGERFSTGARATRDLPLALRRRQNYVNIICSSVTMSDRPACTDLREVSSVSNNLTGFLQLSFPCGTSTGVCTMCTSVWCLLVCASLSNG